MAQLKQDEWPADGEPTTSEAEGEAFKNEGTGTPRGAFGSVDEEWGTIYESVINNVDPDQQGD